MLDFRHHHISINTRSLESAIEFYGMLGFTERYRYSDASVTIAHLLGNGGMVELFFYSSSVSLRSPASGIPHPERVGLDHFSLHIEDVNKAYDELKQFAACEVTSGRTGIDYFFITDPDGTCIEIVRDVRALHLNSSERT